MDLRETWQVRADAWIRWSRSPELDDDFWRFHLPQFLDLLPPPGRLTVASIRGSAGRPASDRLICIAALAMASQDRFH